MPAGALFKLMRPKQWTKNFLVFAGLLFTASFSDRDLLIKALIAFAAMCLASSGTYALNDLMDVERDRLHPRKKNRPIAAGLVSKTAALVFGSVLIVFGLALSGFLNLESLGVMVAYLLLQVFYNGSLKRIPVADVFGLSLGFLLRAVLGTVAISVAISPWLLFCTASLALLLGFAKRRSEFVTMEEDRSQTRPSLGGYSRASLDALVLVSAAVAAICYGIYSIESPTAKSHPALFLTTPFVFYGVCRYLYIVFTFDEGGEPETVLLKDRHVQCSVLAFLVMAFLVLRGLSVPWIEGIRP